MSNMSYCRWQNTALDLRDCAESLDRGDPESLSRDEKAARKRLFLTMIDMLEAIGVSHEIDSHELERVLEAQGLSS